MDDNKWTYIIGVDLVVGIILCVLGWFQELAFVYVTFFVMCISGILMWLRSEGDKLYKNPLAFVGGFFCLLL